MKRTKWWLYTVLIGLIPFIIRLCLSFVVSNTPEMYFFNEVDVATFGLVLIISTMSEIDEQQLIEKHIVMIIKVFLVIILILLSILLGISYLMEVTIQASFDKGNLRLFSCGLAFCAFVLSIAVFYNKNFDNGIA